MYKNTAGQYIFASVVDSSDGSPKTTGVDFYITKDNGSQTAVNSATHVGNGQWRIDLTQAETNADVIGICWAGTNVVPGNITLYPVAKKTQDYQTELSRLDAAITSRLAAADVPNNFKDLAITETEGKVTVDNVDDCKATGFSTHSPEDVKSAIESEGSKLSIVHSKLPTYGIADQSLLTAIGNDLVAHRKIYSIERAAKLDNLDATITSRLAADSYTAPPTVDAIRSELSSDFDQLNTKLNAIGYIHQVQIEGDLSPDVTGTYTRTDPKGLFKIRYVNEAETWYYGQRDTGEWIITFDASGGKPTWDAYWEGTQQLLTPGNEHATGTAFVVNIVLGAELSNKVLSNVASAITDSLPGVELDSSTLAEMANIVSSAILGSPEFTRLVPGTGPVPFEYTVYRPDGETVIPEVFVYVYNSPTLTYNNLVATGITNNHGKVTLFLTPGTYYFVRVKAGYRFENPDIEIVEAL